MNEYKITYATPETDMDYTLITERTESAATKAFKARYKGTGTTTCALPEKTDTKEAKKTE